MEIQTPYYEDSSRISRSSLNWFKISPRYFKDRIDGKIIEEATKAMDNGTMTHMYLLQEKEFKETYKVLDFETPSSAQQKQFCQDYIDSKLDKPILRASEAFKLNYSTKSKSDEEVSKLGLEMALKLKPYIKWLRGNKNGQKTMSWAQFNGLKIIKENILLHKLAKELLFNQGDSPEFVAHNEFHINWEFNIGDGRIISCKSLIDRLIFDHINKVIKLIDIKTTISNSNFKKSYEEYDYGMQMAFYWMAIYWYCANVLKIDIEEYTAETYLITIENVSKECRVLRVPEGAIISKTEEIVKTLTDIDWHMKNNLWDFTKEYYEGDGSESLLYDIT